MLKRASMCYNVTSCALESSNPATIALSAAWTEALWSRTSQTQNTGLYRAFAEQLKQDGDAPSVCAAMGDGC